MFAFSILFRTEFLDPMRFRDHSNPKQHILRPQDAWRQRMGDTRGQERGPEPSKSQDRLLAEWGWTMVGPLTP